ncbi:MAG: T9SS type A sorting domain-containing protein [candidate division KSB1 bacterium]|nr:T9SS type A sorting domain-containing protein [candidate division KSB1 bacterium]MDZ7276260.1 T9SS type A sorting domain-containing protein [candidate division KSB1 bacterium]MDZ7287934.1 T9SS type A sorting domain-containing protein [candidate division KSB1 bacterium]MDZ7300053.1 T9SS type A sorting domain-containing protein [candidate division KSB1 bacterium]MDZ7351055.1 T9SS type A sorting domain-containing protein [candidate division KSB1 bacterium]
MLLLFPGGYALAQIASLDASLRLQTVAGIAIPHQNGIPVPSFEKQRRTTINLAGPWRKQRFAANHDLTLLKRDAAGMAELLAEAAGRQEPGYDDSGWPLHHIPGVENTINAYEKRPEYYQDGVWYRRVFAVPGELRGKFAKLIFYAVNYVADVWLNGRYLGYHEGGYTSFAFDATPALRYDTLNVIAVRVDNPPWGSRTDIIPYSRVDWFNYTGILHDVYLEFADEISVVRADIVPKDLNGRLQTTVTVFNAGTAPQDVEIALQVYAARVDSQNILSESAADLLGAPVAVSGETRHGNSVPAREAAVWRTEIIIANPRLWSPQTPHLYILQVTLARGSRVVDAFHTQFGVRTAKTSGTKFLLNEKPAFFVGVARHEDHPVYGRSMPVAAIYNDLVKIKALNANWLRTAHYPNHPFTYLATDRLGLVVMEEIPLWQFDVALAWVLQNLIRHLHEQMFREMVFRDYNRPSIVLWSTNNESMDVDNRRVFIKRVNEELDSLYPDGRLVGQSAAADRPGPHDPSQTVSDFAGWTMYFGIFYGQQAYTETKYFLVDANLAHPNKPILNTEFGYWSSENGSTAGQQVTIFNETFRALKQRAAIDSVGKYDCCGYLMAATWWCAFDWYRMTEGYQSMGVLRMDRVTEKPVTPVLRAAYLPYFKTGGFATAVEERGADGSRLPQHPQLEQNYPNPFNPGTKIRFMLPQARHVRLRVLDVLGREKAVLLDEVKNAGSHEVIFSTAQPGGDWPSGVYFCELSAGAERAVKKMILLR